MPDRSEGMSQTSVVVPGPPERGLGVVLTKPTPEKIYCYEIMQEAKTPS
jgi:Rieske Fe-S protein